MREEGEMSTALALVEETVIDRVYNGVTIGHRQTDGYFDATAMCRAAGKRWHDYWETKQARAFAGVVAINQNLALNQVIQSVPHMGTWVHEDIAIDLAMWISPEFKLRVIQWAKERMGMVEGSYTPQR
jgi:hypothetical protein